MEKKYLIVKVGKRPSVKAFRKILKQIRKKREDFKKKEIANCHICKKNVLNKEGGFELGTIQIGSDDGKSIWSFHAKCYNKYTHHFCQGEEVWMPICKECKDEEDNAIKEFNKPTRKAGDE